MAEQFDAVVVGSGPNGLAAAITLGEAGKSVLVLEAAGIPGGGLRTQELLEPGFRHDVCSTIMALPPLLPFFAPLRLELVTPPAPIAHPFDDGTVVIVERSVEHTASRLRGDAADYRRLMHPLAARAPELLSMVLGPPRPPRHPPRGLCGRAAAAPRGPAGPRPEGNAGDGGESLSAAVPQ